MKHLGGIMRGIDKKRWNELIREIGASKTEFRKGAYVKITDDVFLELDFNVQKNYFGVDILEGTFDMSGPTSGYGYLNYTSGYTPNLLPTVVKLVKDYVAEKSFKEIREYEHKNSVSFSDFFEEKTGIPYKDLVMYS